MLLAPALRGRLPDPRSRPLVAVLPSLLFHTGPFPAPSSLRTKPRLAPCMTEASACLQPALPVPLLGQGPAALPASHSSVPRLPSPPAPADPGTWLPSPRAPAPPLLGQLLQLLPGRETQNQGQCSLLPSPSKALPGHQECRTRCHLTPLGLASPEHTVAQSFGLALGDQA